MTASWIVVDKASGKALFETFNPKVANAINRTKYQAVPALTYLANLNAEIKRESQS